MLFEVFSTVKKSTAIPAVEMAIFAVSFEIIPIFEVVIAGVTDVVPGRVPDVLVQCRFRVELPVAAVAIIPIHLGSARMMVAVIWSIEAGPCVIARGRIDVGGKGGRRRGYNKPRSWLAPENCGASLDFEIFHKLTITKMFRLTRCATEGHGRSRKVTEGHVFKHRRRRESETE